MNTRVPYFAHPLIITLLTCFAGTSVAQTFTLRGSLADEQDRFPLIGASVTLAGTALGTTTDENGRFSITGIPAGNQVVRASYIGYGQLETTVDVTREVDLQLTMERKAIDLGEVNVSPRSAATTTTTISGLDRLTRPVNSSQDLLQLVPGLFIAQHAGGGKAEQIFFRGFDIDHGTDLQVSVDGMPVNMVSHAHGQGYADLNFIKN